MSLPALPAAPAPDDRPVDQPLPVNKLAELYLFDPLARYEETASRFYRETGIMAPGKDIPVAMAEQPITYAERCERFTEWLNAQVTRVRSLTTERAE